MWIECADNRRLDANLLAQYGQPVAIHIPTMFADGGAVGSDKEPVQGASVMELVEHHLYEALERLSRQRTGRRRQGEQQGRCFNIGLAERGEEPTHLMMRIRVGITDRFTCQQGIILELLECGWYGQESVGFMLYPNNAYTHSFL